MGELEPESFSLCPLCDQPIFDYEETEIITGFGMKILTHLHCSEEE